MKKILFKKLNYPLIVILLIAFSLRVWGIWFGKPFTLQPDETKIIEPSLTMALDIKSSLKGVGEYPYFYPNFFFYPHFLFYFFIAFVQVLKVFLIPFGGIDILQKFDFYLIARLTSALIGTASVYLVYKITGLLSFYSKFKSQASRFLPSLIFALSFLHIRLSHYYTGDVWSIFFILLSLLFFLKYLSDLKAKNLILAFFICGIGISTKYYPFLSLIVYFFVLLLLKKFHLKQVLLAGIFSLFGFFLFTPHSLTHFKEFKTTFQESSARSKSGFMGSSSKSPLYYIYNKDKSIDEWYSGNDLTDSVGFPVLIFSLIGYLILIKNFPSASLRAGKFQISNLSSRSIFLFMVLPLAYYLFFSLYFTKLIRWLGVLMPFISIFATVGLLYLKDKLKLGKYIFLLLVFLTLLIPLKKSLVYIWALGNGDTRVKAYNFIEQSVPHNSTLIFESIGIHNLYESGNWNMVQIGQPRYNTKGELEENFPPKLDDLIKTYTTGFILINGQNETRFNNPSAKKYYPEVSTKWLEFYGDLKMLDWYYYDSNAYLYGPQITIYKF